MTPEEYQRIKEAEKAHLRSLKKLQAALGALRKTQAVREALDDLARTEHTLDESTALIDRLAAETAQQEARLDLALDAVAARGDDPADADEDVARTRLDRAQALLRQLKHEIEDSQAKRRKTEDSQAKGRPSGEARTQHGRAAEGRPDSSHPAAPSSSDELPPKTIGRMK